MHGTAPIRLYATAYIVEYDSGFISTVFCQHPGHDETPEVFLCDTGDVHDMNEVSLFSQQHRVNYGVQYLSLFKTNSKIFKE
jgi:hypothetical protein